MSEKLISLSVIIPAYNEEDCLESGVRTINDFLCDELKDKGFEIILIDDGSKDRTLEIAEKLEKTIDSVKVLKHKFNMGQGATLMTGFSVSEGEIVIPFDADLSYSAEHIGVLYKEIEETGFDIILASPYAPDGNVQNVPFLRRVLSKYANKFLRYAYNRKYYTLTCVVRAYKGDILRDLVLTENGMEINLEILEIAEVLNLKIGEIPALLQWGSGRKTSGRRSFGNLYKTIKHYMFYGFLMRPSLLFK